MKNKKVLVFGLGLSGRAIVKRLSELGAQVVATDSSPAQSLDFSEIKNLKNVQYFLGGHPFKILKGIDLIVLSPGIHLDLAILEAARKKRIPTIGEVELAFQLLKKPIIAITGTNGKSTTATLTGEILASAGFKVAVAGNIGYPLISVRDEKLDYIVAEISSYQLESIVNFKPFISVILNITPDHQERHQTMARYALIKKRIFKNQTPRDFLVFNDEDKIVRKIVSSARSEKLPFSLKRKLKKGLYLKSSVIKAKIFKKTFSLMPVKEIPVPGWHNVENVMAAAAGALILGVAPEKIRGAIRAFKGLEHRIELVRNLKGVKFYNDSKGTNPDSTVIALKALARPGKRKIIIILGGRDKGTSLKKMAGEIKKSVKELVLLGEAASRFEKYFRSQKINHLHRVKTFPEGVHLAHQLSQRGDVVLLSPASASFDMFRNFEERGQVFKELVTSL